MSFQTLSNKYEMVSQTRLEFEQEPDDNPQIVLNQALEKIGFGKYQLILFILCGLGWAADNALFQLLAVTVQQINYEYDLKGLNSGLSTTVTYIGSACGAMMWGAISDVVGRRPAFMYTFIITALFCITSGLFKNIYLVCGSLFLMGIGFRLG
jgi:MFS family permease